MKNIANIVTSYEAFVMSPCKHERLERAIMNYMEYCAKRIDDCNWIIFDAPEHIREMCGMENVRIELERYTIELERNSAHLERMQGKWKKHIEVRPWS